MRGTSILLLANGVNRVFEFAYRVYLVRLVGSETIGAFQVVLPFYFTLLIIGSAGIPAAVANLVAEKRARADYAGAHRIVSTAILMVGTLSFLVTLGLTFSAWPVVTRIIRDPRLYLALLAIAPAVTIVPICSIYRAYFQGMQNMIPVATAQLVEQITHIAVTLPLAAALLPYGLDMTLVGMGVGLTLGELSGIIYIIGAYARDQRDVAVHPWTRPVGEAPAPGDLPAMFRLAVPITASRLLASVSWTLSAILIPRSLEWAGNTQSQATALYGQLTGMAFPILNAPTIITYALSYNLVPAISAAYSKRDVASIEALLSRSLKITQVVALPAAVCLYLLAEPISLLAFDLREPGVPLAVLALGSPFLHFEAVVSGVLQGLGKPALALKNFAIGETLSLLAIYLLTPPLGVKGAAIGIMVGIVLEGIMDYASTLKVLGIRLPLGRVLWKPAMAAAAMAVLLLALRQVSISQAGAAATIVSLGLGWAAYAVALVSLGGLGREDFRA